MKILLMLLPLALWANVTDLKVQKKVPQEINLRGDEATFIERNSTTGIFDRKYNTGEDKNRLSLMASINANLLDPTSFMGYELQYARKLTHSWLEFFIATNSATYSSIADKESDEAQSLLSTGAGLGHRFKMLQFVFDSDKFFETLSAFVAYHMMDDTLDSNSYKGPGLKVDYGIHIRTSSRLHWGLKLSYNFATITREALNDTETKSDRSTSLSWASLGLEMGFYF